MTPKSANLPWALIGAACLGSFAATSSGTTRAPFLLEMSHDLGVSMPLVANLVSMTATSWGFTSAFGGWMSDRIGRRVLLEEVRAQFQARLRRELTNVQALPHFCRFGFSHM